MQQSVINKFESIFNSADGQLYSAAGRINLIGEHTDYNEGFVFPGAIDKCMVAKVAPNGTSKVKVYAIDLDEVGEFDPYVEEAHEQSWLRYIYGVCREVIKRGGKVKGFNAAFAGSVPLGAGLSSSAALESVFAFAINDLFNDGAIEKMELARIGQSTEHNYCGVKCGIMDQFASIFGLEGSLIRLDCRSMEYEYYPFKADDYTLVLINTCVKHELVGSPYNRRRESCERVAATLGMPSLRGATEAQLEAVKDKVSEEDFARARYVIGEERRILAVCDALKANDFESVGAAMYETHDGLSGDYDVSCVELDFLVGVARECGVTGARMMGGGFGGCTINLVKNELLDNFISTALDKYKAEYGIDAEVIEVNIKNGAQKL